MLGKTLRLVHSTAGTFAVDQSFAVRMSETLAECVNASNEEEEAVSTVPFPAAIPGYVVPFLVGFLRLNYTPPDEDKQMFADASANAVELRKKRQDPCEQLLGRPFSDPESELQIVCGDDLHQLIWQELLQQQGPSAPLLAPPLESAPVPPNMGRLQLFDAVVAGARQLRMNGPLERLFAYLALLIRHLTPQEVQALYRPHDEAAQVAAKRSKEAKLSIMKSDTATEVADETELDAMERIAKKEEVKEDEDD